MYRVYARFIPTGKTSSSVMGIAGLNALEHSRHWEVLAVERIKFVEEI
jgi:hypothetical protein